MNSLAPTPTQLTMTSPMLSSRSGNSTTSRLFSLITGRFVAVVESTNGRIQPGGVGPLFCPCATIVGSTCFCSVSRSAVGESERPVTMRVRLCGR